MIALLLVVVLIIGGACACVVWAERGGPLWVRIIARITLFASDVVRASSTKRSSGGSDD